MLYTRFLGAGLMILTVLAVVAAGSAAAEEHSVEGLWQGVLKVGGVELRIVFHITPDADGVLTSTMDSPDQGAQGIKVDTTSFEAPKLRLEMKGIGGVFEGALSADGEEIKGNWSQAGMSLPLTLKPIESVEKIVRPQDPVPPLPYREEEVSYPNEGAGIRLAGTLTMPEAGEPFPAVLLISGSGPQNRNEEIMNHRPFLVLADYLTRRGIAVLRVDDRGVGASTGDFATATCEDFASDVLAGVAYLRSRPDVADARIGLIGHSEGGIVAPMVAAQSSRVAFIVMLAGTGVTGEEVMLEQGALITKAGGATDLLVAANRAISQRLFDVVKNAAESADIRELLEDALESLPEDVPEDLQAAVNLILTAQGKALEAQLGMMLSPWFRFFLTYDPVIALRKVRCPVLAINGENDLQVSPHQNLPPIEEALKAGGNQDYRIEELPGLNHLLQTSKTGSPADYAKIEETISPTALELIAGWIREHTGLDSRS